MDLPFSGDLIAALVFPGVLGIFGFLVVAIWLERKLVARVQWRYGPLYVSKPLGGLLQPRGGPPQARLLGAGPAAPHQQTAFRRRAHSAFLGDNCYACSGRKRQLPVLPKNVSANAVDGGAASQRFYVLKELVGGYLRLCRAHLSPLKHVACFAHYEEDLSATGRGGV